MAAQGEIFAQAPQIEVQPPTPAELRTLFRAFKDAKDKWKIDAATMKGYYLHTESGYLYIWHQATGVLYEHLQSSGQCQAVWSSAVPQLNAEIWTVLPLPPTDPASMQASCVQNGELPNIDVFVVLTIAHEADKQVPSDVLDAAVEEFAGRWELRPEARLKLTTLPPAGQCFALQNFRGDPRCQLEASEALERYVGILKKERPPPWGHSACTLRVESTGAIIGRCCPDLDALCRDDPPERLAQAQCKIRMEQDRFFICDMETSEEGTTLDGFAVNSEWVGPLKTGSLLVVGPLRIKITLSDMAKDTALDAGAMRQLSKRPLAGSDSDEDPEWKRKVFKRSDEDAKALWKQRQEQYKDRAEERRKKTGGESGAAIDTLINRFEQKMEAERQAAEAEEARVDKPTQVDHREAGMNVDGSFIGFGNMERAGIGFGSSQGAELIPDVLDPKNLSAQDSSRMKTQMRFKQAEARYRQ